MTQCFGVRKKCVNEYLENGNEIGLAFLLAFFFLKQWPNAEINKNSIKTMTH